MTIRCRDLCCGTGNSKMKRAGAARFGARCGTGPELRSIYMAIAFVASLLAAFASLPSAALAVDPIVLAPSEDKIDITLLGEFYERRGDKLNVETAAGADGIV